MKTSKGAARGRRERTHPQTSSLHSTEADEGAKATEGDRQRYCCLNM